MSVACLSGHARQALGGPEHVSLAASYQLGQVLSSAAATDKARERLVELAAQQAQLAAEGKPHLPAPWVIREVASAGRPQAQKPNRISWHSAAGKPSLSIASINNNGLTLKVHAGSGASSEELLKAFSEALDHLASQTHKRVFRARNLRMIRKKTAQSAGRLPEPRDGGVSSRTVPSVE